MQRVAQPEQPAQQAEAAGLAYKQLLVWVKSASGGGGMGSFYRSGHELVGVFKKNFEEYATNEAKAPRKPVKS